jgi:DNA repair protein RecO (recombination protein O)
VHEALQAVLDHLDDRLLAAALVARFELAMLGELGFGLELDQCAATGAIAELIYVSPKSGRAVSRAAGEPWQDRLLRLPAFLREEGGPAEGDVAAAFALTGFFLARHVLEPRGAALPDARERFIAAVLREPVALAVSG